MMETQHSIHKKYFDSAFYEKSSLSMELSYQVRVEAQLKNKTKTILKDQKGIIPAKSFTAILGPSGSGKTTLLNFLGGRLMSTNINVEGTYRINRQPISSVEPYSKKIGYTMQEDALLAALTPRQSLQFVADLHLQLPLLQREQKVQKLLEELGLIECGDVKIGNNLMKGISGGQRRRTSIGIELITDPHAIFLDEPTTGLDSTTAYQVILLLKHLSLKGKTIITTIHQPSSELFGEFDRLILLSEGRCIYAGSVDDSFIHFSSIGYPCPESMNAAQFYLDLISMNLEEGEEDYEEKRQLHEKLLLKLEDSFKDSIYSKMIEDERLSPIEFEKQGGISILYQVFLLFYRSLVCHLRNPMDVAVKVIQSILTALIVFMLFGRINNDDHQNVRGLSFFVVSQNVFGGIQGTLAIFCTQRPVFIRQRFSKSYSAFSYFLASTGCNFFFDLIYPTLGMGIIYWVTGMGISSWEQFWKIIIIINCTFFLSSSFGLMYASLISKVEIAMLFTQLLLVPFMLLSGFFTNYDQVSDVRLIFQPLIYLSPFKYGFQGIMIALGNKFQESFHPSTFQSNVYLMIVIGLVIRMGALIAMEIVSTPSRPKMKAINQS